MGLDSHFKSETKEKTCCFFGHRDTPFALREQIKLAIRIMILTGQADCFYVGTHGNFDRMVYGVLKELRRQYPHIHCHVVLAYPPDDKTKKWYGDDAVYPDSTAAVDPKFAVYDRNDWMIERSRYVICYIAHATGGAYHFVDKARGKGLTVINVKS